MICTGSDCDHTVVNDGSGNGDGSLDDVEFSIHGTGNRRVLLLDLEGSLDDEFCGVLQFELSVGHDGQLGTRGNDEFSSNGDFVIDVQSRIEDGDELLLGEGEVLLGVSGDLDLLHVGFGVGDVVSGRSDCNRSAGHLYELTVVLDGTGRSCSTGVQELSVDLDGNVGSDGEFRTVGDGHGLSGLDDDGSLTTERDVSGDGDVVYDDSGVSFNLDVSGSDGTAADLDRSLGDGKGTCHVRENDRLDTGISGRDGSAYTRT